MRQNTVRQHAARQCQDVVKCIATLRQREMAEVSQHTMVIGHWSPETNNFK